MSSLCVAVREQLAFHQLCPFKFFNAEWDAKDVSSISWHVKPANQSGSLNSARQDWHIVKVEPFIS